MSRNPSRLPRHKKTPAKQPRVDADMHDDRRVFGVLSLDIVPALIMLGIYAIVAAVVLLS